MSLNNHNDICNSSSLINNLSYVIVYFSCISPCIFFIELWGRVLSTPLNLVSIIIFAFFWRLQFFFSFPLFFVKTRSYHVALFSLEPLCRPSWSQTLRNFLALTSRMYTLKVYATVPRFLFIFNAHHKRLLYNHRKLMKLFNLSWIFSNFTFFLAPPNILFPWKQWNFDFRSLDCFFI